MTDSLSWLLFQHGVMGSQLLIMNYCYSQCHLIIITYQCEKLECQSYFIYHHLICHKLNLVYIKIKYYVYGYWLFNLMTILVNLVISICSSYTSYWDSYLYCSFVNLKATHLLIILALVVLKSFTCSYKLCMFWYTTLLLCC